MTALLWETALLLLGAYFLGAFTGCLVRRTFFAPVIVAPSTRPDMGMATPVDGYDPAPIPATATEAAFAESGQPAPARASARFERALTGEEAEAAPDDHTVRHAEPRQPVEGEDEPAQVDPPRPARPVSADLPAATDRHPVSTDRIFDGTGQERPARSIGTSAAAAAALAAATARHQAEQAAARARAEADREGGGHSLPAAAGASEHASGSPPAVRGPAAGPARTIPQAVVPADDLERIRGIDPDLQKRLDALGVRRFADIAAWKKDDVRRVSQALGFRGRIQQENWIEQAQILMGGAETAFSRSRIGMWPLAKPSPDQGEHRPISGTSQTSTKGLPAAVAGPAPATAAQPRRPVAGLGRENLQRIGRITSDIERLLNVQGVNRYEQIAHWSTSDVARFEQHLGGDGRISRENWIEQAHILARGGETAYSREIDKQAAVLPRPRPTQLAEAIRAAQAEGAAQESEPAEELERAPSPRVDLNALRSVRSEALRSDEPKEPGTTGPSQQPTSGPDDLKRIRGIGVLLEKRLYSMGCRTYEQVASWTAADVDRVSRALDIRGRIERENWVEQARILASGERTDFAKRLDRGEVPVSRAAD